MISEEKKRFIKNACIPISTVEAHSFFAKRTFLPRHIDKEHFRSSKFFLSTR
jgi:hypothetical protein